MLNHYGPVYTMADVVASVVDVITTVLHLESKTIVADVIATYSYQHKVEVKHQDSQRKVHY